MIKYIEYLLLLSTLDIMHPCKIPMDNIPNQIIIYLTCNCWTKFIQHENAAKQMPFSQHHCAETFALICPRNETPEHQL